MMDSIEDTMDARIQLVGDDEVTYEDSLHNRMSQFFGKLARGLGWGPQPTKVNSVNWSEYNQRAFTFNEGPFLIFLLPEDDLGEDPNLAYELIIHKELNSNRNAYSLLRTCSETEARAALQAYGVILDPLVDSCGKEVLCTHMLQKILDYHRDHPTYNAAHIATQFAFMEALKNEQVLRFLDIGEDDEGIYPLHIAVENESEKVINALICANAAVDVTDNDGNTPLHIAANKSVAVIQALKVKQNPVLNKKNNAGETPLLIAAHANKLDIIKLLIQLGSNLNHKEQLPSRDDQSYWEKIEKLLLCKDISSKDLHKGGSLLHWVKTRELTDLCLDLGCDPDLTNSLNQTPLHVLVSRNRIQCCVSLLCRGAKANYSDLDGMQPLHLACAQCHVTLVQAFIVFGSEINAMNKKGETARHLAAACTMEDKVKAAERDKVIYLLHTVGAKRCSVKLSSCSDGCVEEGSFNGVPLYEKPLLRSRWILDEELSRTQISEAIRWQIDNRDANRKPSGRVLCLDGGGIKGLVMTQMLFVIQEVLGRPINECFDWISGTSTGGFLALMLCSGKCVQDVQSLYYSLKEKVFVGGRPYDAAPLEDILIKEFGEDTVMSSIKHPRVMVTSTLADRLPPDLHLFRNYESPMSVLGIHEDSVFMNTHPPNKQKLWLAARCSGAAPTYFSASEKFLDGGLVSNNPVLDTLAEIEEWNMAVRAKGRHDEVFTPSVVVSLGCGKPPVMLVDTVDITMPSLLEVRRGLQAMYNLFNVLVEQACSSEGRVVDRARAWCSALHVPLFRFNPQLTQDMALDEHVDDALVRAMWETRSYMRSQGKILAQLKPLLVGNMPQSANLNSDKPDPNIDSKLDSKCGQFDSDKTESGNSIKMDSTVSSQHKMDSSSSDCVKLDSTPVKSMSGCGGHLNSLKTDCPSSQITGTSNSDLKLPNSETMPVNSEISSNNCTNLDTELDEASLSEKGPSDSEKGSSDSENIAPSSEKVPLESGKGSSDCEEPLDSPTSPDYVSSSENID